MPQESRGTREQRTGGLQSWSWCALCVLLASGEPCGDPPPSYLIHTIPWMATPHLSLWD